MVSIYDVLRNMINNYYAKKALENPKAKNTKQDIISTEIANKEGLTASIIFSLICIIIAVIFVRIMYKYNIL